MQMIGETRATETERGNAIVLLMILGVIGSVGVALGAALLAHPRGALQKRSIHRLNTIQRAAERFAADTNELPRNLDELRTAPRNRRGWNGPYLSRSIGGPDPLEALPRDAWGQRWRWTTDEDALKIASPGRDGAWDTTDDLTATITVNGLKRAENERRTRTHRVAARRYYRDMERRSANGSVEELPSAFNAYYQKLVSGGFLPHTDRLKQDPWGGAYRPSRSTPGGRIDGVVSSTLTPR